MRQNGKDDKSVVFNRRVIGLLLLVAIMVALALSFIQENGIIEGIIFLLIGAIGIFVLFCEPIYFVFTDQEIRIKYWFGLEEWARWDEVKYIDEESDDSGASPPNFYSYEITPMKGSRYFFMQGRVAKRRRTRKLIHQYWSGTIAGELTIYDFFPFLKKKKNAEKLPYPTKRKRKKRKRKR